MFDPEERATKGLEDLFTRGAVVVTDLTLDVKPLGRPGRYNFGGTYRNARYRSFDPAANLSVPPELVRDENTSPQETGSWSVYANFCQSLWVDAAEEKRNWGVFGQFGVSDGNPHPVRFVANGGVGGRSTIPGRKYDTFGVGYFYLGLSDNFKALASPNCRSTTSTGWNSSTTTPSPRGPGSPPTSRSPARVRPGSAP